ncbi:phosphodiesterase [Burkholderia sp. SRS-46]|nr:phosphodiesterase [Burkholderia sp. SRS-46]
MKILSHRGYWKEASEKNTPLAFHRSFDMGFGTETDVRDRLGELVISHDPATMASRSLDSFIDIVSGRNLPLAMNVKADGLAVGLADAFNRRALDWFVFDMSIPDMKMQLKAGNPVFARMSEVEQAPAWLDQIQGIWLDAFSQVWYNAATIIDLLARGLRVCVVSAELHGRAHGELWSALRDLKDQDRLMICTDLPEECQRFFG